MIALPKDIASKIILVLILVVIAFSVKFIGRQEKWSPIDEYAHMDYVNKISECKLPSLSDSISNELFIHIKTDTLRNSHKNIFASGQFEMAAISYEAIHPPLYYSILSIPNIVMENMNFPLFSRLKVLRIISYFLFVAGMFLCLPMFKLLSNLGYSIPVSYGWGCVLFGLFIVTNERYGLSNNMLSPLMVNASICFLLKYLNKPTNKNMYFFLAFAGLSMFTAISNVFIIPVLCLFFLKKYITHISLKNFTTALLMGTVFISLFYLWKTNTKPDKTIDDSLQFILSYYIPAGMVDYKTFMQLFLLNAFTLSFIKPDLFQFGYIIILLFISSNFICLILLKTLLKKQTWIIYAGVLAMTFFISSFLVNKYIPTIHWMAFRHYLGFIPVFYVSCTGGILLLVQKFKK